MWFGQVHAGLNPTCCVIEFAAVIRVTGVRFSFHFRGKIRTH